MSKLPNKKPRVPNQDGLKKIAQLFVHHQVVKQLGEEGAKACLRISLLLEQVGDAYQTYFDLVDKATVNIPEFTNFFPASAWAKLNNEQKRKLQHAIEKEVGEFVNQVSGHMQYLDANKQHMTLMSPGGAAMLEQVRDEILGIEQ